MGVWGEEGGDIRKPGTSLIEFEVRVQSCICILSKHPSAYDRAMPLSSFRMNSFWFAATSHAPEKVLPLPNRIQTLDLHGMIALRVCLKAALRLDLRQDIKTSIFSNLALVRSFMECF